MHPFPSARPRLLRTGSTRLSALSELGSGREDQNREIPRFPAPSSPAAVARSGTAPATHRTENPVGGPPRAPLSGARVPPACHSERPFPSILDLLRLSMSARKEARNRRNLQFRASGQPLRAASDQKSQYLPGGAGRRGILRIHGGDFGSAPSACHSCMSTVQPVTAGLTRGSRLSDRASALGRDLVGPLKACPDRPTGTEPDSSAGQREPVCPPVGPAAHTRPAHRIR